jgi:biopolymer transport protein ExbB/TolQ
LFELGGPAMWAISALAVVGAAIFAERMLAVASLTRQLQALDGRLRDAVMAGKIPELMSLCAKAPAGTAAVLMRGLEAAVRQRPRDDIFGEMSREGRRLSMRLRRGLGMLATLGSMAPFVGLFGTVLGIMQALKNISAAGTTGLEVVSAGVSEALVTTAAGIMVAIVMVLLHQWLRASLNSAVLEVQVLVEDAADLLARVPAPLWPQGGVPVNQAPAAGGGDGAA